MPTMQDFVNILWELFVDKSPHAWNTLEKLWPEVSLNISTSVLVVIPLVVAFLGLTMFFRARNKAWRTLWSVPIALTAPVFVIGIDLPHARQYLAPIAGLDGGPAIGRLYHTVEYSLMVLMVFAIISLVTVFTEMALGKSRNLSRTVMYMGAAAFLGMNTNFLIDSLYPGLQWLLPFSTKLVVFADKQAMFGAILQMAITVALLVAVLDCGLELLWRSGKIEVREIAPGRPAWS